MTTVAVQDVNLGSAVNIFCNVFEYFVPPPQHVSRPHVVRSKLLTRGWSLRTHDLPSFFNQVVVYLLLCITYEVHALFFLLLGLEACGGQV